MLYFAGYPQVALDILQLLMLLLAFPDEPDLLHGIVDTLLQVVQVYRLRCKVECSVVHGRTYILHISVGRDHDYLQGRVSHFVHLSQHGQTIHLRHVDVAQDDIDVRMQQQLLQTFNTIVGEEEFIFSFSNLSAEVLGEEHLQIHLIIYT